MKKLTITFTENGDKLYCEAENKGFNAFEIIGLLETKRLDIFDQIQHHEQFKRYIVKDDGTRQEIVKENEDTE